MEYCDLLNICYLEGHFLVPESLTSLGDIATSVTKRCKGLLIYEAPAVLVFETTQV